MGVGKSRFAAVDKMRGTMGLGEYKHVALGPLFLRYISTAFARLHDELTQDDTAEDVDEYATEDIF